MAIIQQNNISVPKSSDWLSFTPINAHDLAGVIEPAQQHYARKGIVVWGASFFHDPINNFSSTPILVGGITDNVATAHRIDHAGDIQIEACVAGRNAAVTVRVERVSPGGAKTLISSYTGGTSSTSFAWLKVALTLSFGDTREGGEPAPLCVSLKFAPFNSGSPGEFLAGIVHAYPLVSGDLP